MKLSKKVKVLNRLGLHTRPATVIAKLLQQCKSHVEFTYGSATINAKSVISILTLAAECNSDITITCDGDDASFTMQLLVNAFEERFDEN